MRETNETSELVKLDTIKGLGEDISRHIIGSTMIENNSAFVVSLTDVVVADRDVFRSRMESGILDELDGGLVVAVERDGILENERRVELGKEVSNPDGLLSLGAEGVLPSRHIESFLRVFKQLTHNLPSRQVVSYLSICPPL